jgi:hypothetical protein
MLKGTLTLINLPSVGPGSTTPFSSGSFVGLNHSRNVAVYFEGSFSASAGTPARIDLYPAILPNAGSIDSIAIGSMMLAGAANSVKRRIKWFEDLNSVPYIKVRVLHRTGTCHLMNVKAKAIVQHD